MGVKHVSNGDGTVTQFDEDSGIELVTFPDPDGSFTREHLEPAAAAASTPKPKGDNAERVFARAMELSPAPTQVRPDTETVAPQRPPTGYQSAIVPPKPPEPIGGLAPAQSQTTGIAQSQKPEYAAAATANQAGQRESADKIAQLERDQQEAQALRVQTESDRALGTYATDLELHEVAKAKTLEAEEVARQARATPIDPSQSVVGVKGFYAIMANVGAALSKFGAALLGQQGPADTNLVDDIIAEGVRQQIADRGLAVEGAQDSLDQRRKEELRLSIQANASLENWFQSRAAVEKQPEVRAAYAQQAEERIAAIKDQTFKLGEKLYDSEVQTRAAPKPTGPAKPKPEDKWNAETKEDMEVLAANGVDTKAYTAYGEARGKLGVDVALKHISDVRQIVKDLKEKGSTDVAGVGPIDQRTQALLRSNDASKVQQALGFVVTTFVKNRSGAAVTDKEREYLTKIITGTGSNQEESLENGLRSVEGEVQTQLDTLDSTNSGARRAYDEIRSNRQRRTKLTPEQEQRRDAQLGKGGEPAPGARKRLGTDEQGKPFYESPEAERARVERERQARAKDAAGSSDARARIGKALGL